MLTGVLNMSLLETAAVPATSLPRATRLWAMPSNGVEATVMKSVVVEPMMMFLRWLFRKGEWKAWRY